jgi:hypothetical protein
VENELLISIKDGNRRAADPNSKQISNSRYVGPMPTLDFPALVIRIISVFV